ncbi:MAG: tetratricopeptide repeat protein [Chitinophagales bacterium]
MSRNTLYNSSLSDLLMLRKIVFLLITCIVFQTVQAQNISEQIKLGQEYMKNGEYDKAADLYKVIYNDNPTSNAYYKIYYNCLLILEDYKEIEKIINKQIKKSPENLTYYVDLGYSYEKQNNITDRDKNYNLAISKIGNERAQVIQLANAFMSINDLQRAIDVYSVGKKNVKDYSFNNELAILYYRSGDISRAMDFYIDYAMEDINNLNNVTTSLQRILDEESDHMLFQEKLYNRIQQKDAPVLIELLVWDFVQIKDFESAFIQMKALDKRLKENGSRVYELALTATNEKEYDAAIQCYNYIVQLGAQSPYYFLARNGILDCRWAKIKETNYYTQADIDDLKTNYQNFLNEYNRYDYRAALVTQSLATLEAFYNYDVSGAIALLENVLSWAALNVAQKSEFKITLGDLYLISGDIWEATLLYSQVDKAMKDEPIGEMARFKNAKLAYYRGDFYLAQGQLDVLKASTSELVANDALKLSVFITDNLGLDSILEPMKLFAAADLYLFQNKISDCISTLDTLLKSYPDHKLTDDVYFMKYQIAIKNREMDSAVQYLEYIRSNYAFDLLSDDALFYLGDLYQNYYKDTAKAMACYEELIIQYKDSLFVNEARKRFRILRGDKLN